MMSEDEMLELRPHCGLCDPDLLPDAADACICSYECTYCAHCVETKLHNVCPTCGGGLTPQPIRPKRAWRAGKTLGLGYHPASTTRVHSAFSDKDIAAHVARIKHIAPQDR
jgi:uncharacterized protein